MFFDDFSSGFGRGVMEATNNQVVAGVVGESTAVRKPWVAPVVEIHEVEDLTMAGSTNTNDGAGGSS